MRLPDHLDFYCIKCHEPVEIKYGTKNISSTRNYKFRIYVKLCEHLQEGLNE